MHESQIPRSCDRCYFIKERCIRAPDSDSCDRCLRLNHECVRQRAPKRPGRRPKKAPAAARDQQQQQQQQQTASPASHPASPHADAHETSSMLDRVVADLGLSTVEARLLRQSILSEQFVEQFIVGPSFGATHRAYMARQLYGAPLTLGHAFIASAMSWGEESDVTSPAPGSAKAHSDHFERMYNHATRAVATLRSLQPATAPEMCLCIVLGATIVSFTLKLRVADARAICRQTLELVKPVYTDEALLAATPPDDLCLMSCLQLTNVAESIMFCEPPTLRYRNALHGPEYVDRFVGIAHSILPLLHDVAALSFRFKRERARARAADDNAAAALRQAELAHAALEREVRLWMPGGRAEFAEGRFTPTEVAHMLCQAEAFRNAARLVLHRLRCGFGEQDEAAQAMSSHVLTSVKVTALVTGSIPVCIDFPLIVACLELESESERADYLSSLSPISSYSSRFHDRTRVIFDAAWEARRNGQSLYWHDLAAFIPDSSTV
ncbi:Fungal transcriptional regulatory protein [Cordyceps militaris CM01]|uniref:Fungal transcriptional regulatory protein n=1 Tax=Cordyceps militaris (strain CM01) TaxID=983644 RepID=G3JBY8_CORMM|nr:Fungal transcriptional regulatory protein [Cordyceps militaris CM01]EGX93706.1 Fungal transcriptional regulatory protein [Cordyceps militaris CM01]